MDHDERVAVEKLYALRKQIAEEIGTHCRTIECLKNQVIGIEAVMAICAETEPG